MNSAEDIAKNLEKSKRSGGGYIACCPAHDDENPSLSVCQSGDKVLVKCHAGCTQEEVLSALKAKGLWSLNKPKIITPISKESDIEAILKGTVDLHNAEAVIATQYLGHRGLKVPNEIRNLKFHPDLPYFENGIRTNFPAIVGVAQRPDGSICALQRIYLSTKGKRAPVSNPKKSIGKISEGAIKFSEPHDVLALTEGIETGISVLTATDLPTWSCVSANGLEKVIVPKHVNTVRIFADKDRSEAGEKAAEKLAKRLTSEGIGVFIHLPTEEISEGEKGIDWLDVFNMHGSTAFEESLQNTSPFQLSPELELNSAPQPTPEIVVNGRQQSDLLSEVWDHLVTAQKEYPVLFISGNSLTKIKTINNRKTLSFINTEELREYLVRLADWISVKLQDGEPTKSNVHVSKSLVSLIFNVPDVRLPQISMITRVPYINQNGKIIHNNGYDFESKIFLDGDIQFDKMFLEKIDRDILKQKKNLLLNELLSDFPFKNDSHKINYLSLLILPLIRNLFDCAPIYIIDASCPGSGKTLLAQIFNIILFGEVPKALPFSKDQNEQRKVITSRLAEGDTDLIFFDNLPTGSLDSGIIAFASTQKYWSDRILGLNKTVSIPNNAAWILTGNQLKPTGELIRRSPYIRLEPTSFHPWAQNNQKFKHKNILSWVKSNREELLSSLVYLIRYWVHIGMPRSENGHRLGSFEDWSSIVNGIFQATEISGFLDSHSEDAQLLECLGNNSDLTFLFKIWWENFKENKIVVSDLLNKFEIKNILLDLTGYSNHDALLSETGKLLKKNVGLCFGSLKLHFKQTSKGGKKYYLAQIEGVEGVQSSLNGGQNVLSI